jgi:uncharacterized repeat protein (TIGR03943 family)
MFLLGVSVMMTTITGVYTRYVKPSLLPWLAGSAAVLIVLAVSAAVRDIRRELRDRDDGHAHNRGIIWLLMVPVALLSFIVPPALNARAVSPSAAPLSNISRRPFPDLPAGRAPAVPLPEVLMRIATAPAGGLDGRLITITGFTMKEANHVDLAKIVIVCCAADAQLARLHMSGPAASVAADLPDNTWVRAEGTVPPGQHYSGTSAIPTLDVSSMTRIDPPTNTYGS